MVSPVIPPSTRAGPVGRHLFTAADYHRAVAVQDTIQREVDWLRRAWGCYDDACYQRMLQYSADRLRYRIESDHETPCHALQVQAETSPDGPPVIRILIRWANDDGRRLLRVWTAILNPRVRA